MNETSGTTGLLRCLWLHLSLRRRWQFASLVAMMVLASFAEVISLGAVLPFLTLLTAPDQVFGYPAIQPVVQALGVTSSSELLLPLTLVFCGAALTSGAMRMLLAWASTRYAFSVGADLSIEIFRRTLYQPYPIHLRRNTSELINGISSKANGLIFSTVVPALTLISSTFILTTIVCVLLAIDPIVSMVAIGGFGVIYGSITGVTRSKKIRNSYRIARDSTEVIKAIQESLGGIRDVLIDGSQETYCRVYRSADLSLRRAQASNNFIGQGPRYGIEALGMLMIAALAYVLAVRDQGGVAGTIPVLGALALGAQRSLPVMQQMYQAWSSIQGSHTSLSDTLALLAQPLPISVDAPDPTPALPFGEHIRLNKISFRYAPETPWVLRDIDLTIAKGSRVGFIGPTGSGKSTLLDIVMGLLSSSEGLLEVDGASVTSSNVRSWQKHIAHVPQSIFLTDSTIQENIAFGVPQHQIDMQRVRDAALQAQLADVIETWPEQYQTMVGERGVRLSGGQRQRIGIARALYKQADVIVFDEATSALDNETESSVMQAIDGLSGDLTVLMIAHRHTTLRNCHKIVEIAGGCVVRMGSYEDVVEKRA